MNIVVFSKAGVHFDDRAKGDIMALYVPSKLDIRHFTDIPNINKNTVKERYGDVTLAPLYRVKSDVVSVYGTLPQELSERRQSIEVFLPQDFVPEHCSVFFFVFGTDLIIQGQKIINDDGKDYWGLTLHRTTADTLDDTLVTAISDLLFEGTTGSLCIAAQIAQAKFQKLQEKVEQVGQNLVRFDSLSRKRETTALYAHRDYGLGMLITAMVAFLVLGASVVNYGLKVASLNKVKDELTEIERRIEQQRANRPLAQIQDPAAILNQMNKPLPQQPSAVLHAAADAAAAFGELTSVTASIILSERDLRRLETFVVNAQVLPGFGKELLVDQEKVAQAVLQTRPWIREIERTPGNEVNLKIRVQIK